MADDSVMRMKDIETVLHQYDEGLGDVIQVSICLFIGLGAFFVKAANLTPFLPPASDRPPAGTPSRA